MLLIIALGLSSLVAALPPGEKHPEVVPGSGLPSREAVGLTSAMLYKMPPPTLTNMYGSMSALYQPVCGPEDKRYTSVNDIIPCYYYLLKLDTQDCRVERETSHFCYAGDAVIIGQARLFSGASLYCCDVADAVLWIINNCARPDKSCAGIQAARGNGDLIVGAGTRKFYG